jgi:hypothetical protein
MALPNLSSEIPSGGPEPIGLHVADGDAIVSSLPEPGYRIATDGAIETGLDSFSSEEGDADSALHATTRVPVWPIADDVPRASSLSQVDSTPPRGSKPNVVSMATHPVSQARISVPVAPGPSRIATFVPRLKQMVDLSRIGSTAALLGQTTARMTHSLSATITRPRFHVNHRVVMLLLLLALGFGELWWLSRRLSSPAESLARDARSAPIVVDSTEDVVSQAGKSADPQRMRVTFHSLSSPNPDPTQKTPAWVAITAPVPLEIFERGQRIGTSWSGMRLAPGTHDLRIVNRSQGIDLSKTIEAVAGANTSLTINYAPALAEITASPWADVIVDGVAVGKTPLDKVELSLGRHDVVFTHPALGQRKTTVVVESGKPLKVSMDLKRKGR